MLSLILGVALLGQTPEESWKLQSVTISNVAVKDPSPMLKDFGGLAIGSEWKFDELEDGAGGCWLSGNDCGFQFKPKLGLLVVDREDQAAKIDVVQRFTARITGKTMKLKYKEKGKPVELTFIKEE